MKIGFIGAGKVGCSLGKYFSVNGITITGYFSRTDASAKDAAQFTNSNYYSSPEELIADSDVIFLTVTDGAISSVWNSIKGDALAGKMICHCSGSLSSGIFSDILDFGAYGYSIHPLYAIPSKTTSYQDLAHTLFTLEGDAEHLQDMKAFLEKLGNQVQIIATEEKAKYHAAAVFASNHVVALAQVSMDLLMQCGFSKNHALVAISPLMLGNVTHIIADGPVASLTGPVERNDVTIIEKHLNCMPFQYKELYKELTKVLIDIGKERHPAEDYTSMETLIQKDT